LRVAQDDETPISTLVRHAQVCTAGSNQARSGEQPV
jgi:hypothetical protein